MTKQEVRKLFQKKRTELSTIDVENNSLLIFEQWAKSDFINLTSFHIFLSIYEKNEINTFPFIKYFWKNNKKTYCSKINKNNLIHFELTQHTLLVKNSWGIPEPYQQDPVELEDIDCVLIPLLGYDLKGNRVGYGKGFYDRFLVDFPYAKKIGLSFFDPIPQIEDVEPSDIPLDYIITPNYCSTFPIDEK